MLKKLIKYEFKATGRVLLPLYGALIIFALINKIFNAFETKGNIPLAFTTTIYISIMVAIFVMTFIIIIQRFYKNLLEDEGYLMHTLPVTTSQNIWAKVIVSTVWVIGSGIVSLVSVILLFITGDEVGKFFFNLDKVFKGFIEANKAAGAHLYVIPLEVIILMIVSTAVGILVLYASMCIGQLFPSHKRLGSFGGFILINIIGDIVGNFVMKFRIINLDIVLGKDSVINFEISMLVFILICMLISFILSMVCNYILEKRLNLE